MEYVRYTFPFLLALFLASPVTVVCLHLQNRKVAPLPIVNQPSPSAPSLPIRFIADRALAAVRAS